MCIVAFFLTKLNPFIAKKVKFFLAVETWDNDLPKSHQMHLRSRQTRITIIIIGTILLQGTLILLS